MVTFIQQYQLILYAITLLLLTHIHNQKLVTFTIAKRVLYLSHANVRQHSFLISAKNLVLFAGTIWKHRQQRGLVRQLGRRHDRVN